MDKMVVMQKIIIPILTFVFFVTIANAQVSSVTFPEFVGKKISKIIEKDIGNQNSWREYIFDSNSRIKEKQSFRDLKEVEDIKYDYFDYDSILIKKESINHIGSRVYRSIYKSYFDANKRLKRYEYYSSKDTIVPWIIENNIVYNNNGKIKSYERISKIKDSTSVIHYSFNYSKNYLTLTIKQINNPETVVFKYNKKGNATDLIVDEHNALSAIGGAKVWSKNRKDKYQIRYKYDKFGNWIRSYSVTKFWTYKINKRIITYN